MKREAIAWAVYTVNVKKPEICSSLEKAESHAGYLGEYWAGTDELYALPKPLKEGKIIELINKAAPHNSRDNDFFYINMTRLVEAEYGIEDRYKCSVPPIGWTCSRHKGHSGPCAASPFRTSHDFNEDQICMDQGIDRGLSND